MEKLICFGRVNCFVSKKDGKSYYTVEYIDLSGGKCFTDFISEAEYNAIRLQNIEPGTTCVGNLKLNFMNKAYVSSISIN